MHKIKLYLGIIVILVLFAGFGVITYKGMPIHKIGAQEPEKTMQGENSSQAQEMTNNSTLQTSASIENSPVQNQMISPQTEAENPSKNEISSQEVTQTPTTTTNNTSDSQNSVPSGYSMQEVQGHDSKDDCWSIINGQIYDLTSWVSRHPGGSGAILNLCGTDGSAKFNQKHGGSSKAQSALFLLKIGSLI